METYLVVCQCGQPYSIEKREAGSQRVCMVCRSEIPIPLLLQTSSDLIQARIKHHELPNNRTCPLTGDPTSVVAWIQVDDTTDFEGATMKAGKFIMKACFSMRLAIAEVIARHFDTPAVETKCEPIAVVPLGLANVATEKLVAASQTELASALRTVPIYAYLLDEYPDNRLTVLHIGDLESPVSLNET